MLVIDSIVSFLTCHLMFKPPCTNRALPTRLLLFTFHFLARCSSSRYGEQLSTVVAKVAFLVVVAALVTKLVAVLVGHWVAGLLAGGKCRLAASDPRRRAQPPSREPVSRSQRQRQHQWHPNAQPQCRGPVSHNDNDNTRTVLVPGVIRLRSSFRGSSFQEK